MNVDAVIEALVRNRARQKAIAGMLEDRGDKRVRLEDLSRQERQLRREIESLKEDLNGLMAERKKIVEQLPDGPPCDPDEVESLEREAEELEAEERRFERYLASQHVTVPMTDPEE